MAILIPYTYHIKDGQFLLEPERIFIKCDINYRPAMLEYVWSPMAGSQFAPHCLEPVSGTEPNPVFLVTGSATQVVEALTIVVNNQSFANKYFTQALFNKYLHWACCQCDGEDCSDTCFLLLSGCVAEVNGEGLLI